MKPNNLSIYPSGGRDGAPKKPTDAELGRALEGRKVLKELEHMGTYERRHRVTKAKYPSGRRASLAASKLALPRRRVQRMPGNREDTLDETSTPKEVEVLIENWRWQRSQPT